MYFREMGRNSFAMTFEIGATAEEVMGTLVEELTKVVNGESYYGYNFQSYYEYRPSGAVDYRSWQLMGTGEDGAQKCIALKYYNGQLSIAQGPADFHTNGRMKKFAGWSASRTTWYNITVAGVQSRVTLYVFASKNWLVIYPRMHSAGIGKLPANANADGGLFAFDLNMKQAANAFDPDVNSIAGQLAYLNGGCVSAHTQIRDYDGRYDYAVHYKPTLLVHEVTFNELTGDANIFNQAEAAEDELGWHAPYGTPVSCNGYNILNTFPNHHPGPNQVSELSVMFDAYNHYHREFRIRNPEWRYPRQIFGIKSLQPNGPYNVLDKLMIKCDEKGFIDTENGVAREHVVLRGYAPHTSSGANQFFYAIPS